MAKLKDMFAQHRAGRLSTEDFNRWLNRGPEDYGSRFADEPVRWEDVKARLDKERRLFEVQKADEAKKLTDAYKAIIANAPAEPEKLEKPAPMAATGPDVGDW